MKLTKPKFTHDCTACKFLGHYERHDLYYCEGGPTVIARYGNSGEEYGSGLPFANDSLKILRDRDGLMLSNGEASLRCLLRVAWLIAKDMDVITRDEERAKVWHPKDTDKVAAERATGA